MAGQMTVCPHCGLETKLYVPAFPQDVRVEAKRGASPLGIAALVLGIISCLFCWVPFLGLLAVPLALIGLLLAFVGLIMAGVSKKTGFVFPIGGLIVCLVSIFIAFAVTGGLTAAFQKAIAAGNQTNQKQESDSPNAGTGAAVEEWSKSLSVKQGDVQISITQIIPYPNVNLIIIDVDVKNLSDTKKLILRLGAGATTFQCLAQSQSQLIAVLFRITFKTNIENMRKANRITI
jgi:hypothetical protein